MATVQTWLPKFFATSEIRSGFLIAAELMDTLSAPAPKRVSTSFSSWMPPPTVKGMEIWAAMRFTKSTKVLRPSCEAVMSRKTSSSAPWRLYSAPSSTGSPTFRIFTKLMPLTVCPSLMSRQGMIRFASIIPRSFSKPFRPPSHSFQGGTAPHRNSLWRARRCMGGYSLSWRWCLCLP